MSFQRVSSLCLGRDPISQERGEVYHRDTCGVFCVAWLSFAPYYVARSILSCDSDTLPLPRDSRFLVPVPVEVVSCYLGRRSPIIGGRRCPRRAPYGQIVGLRGMPECRGE